MSISFNEDLIKGNNRKSVQINKKLKYVSKPLYFINDRDMFYYITDHKECEINWKIGIILTKFYAGTISENELKNSIIMFRPYDKLTVKDLKSIFCVNIPNEEEKVEDKDTLLLINLLMKTNRYVFKYFLNLLNQTSDTKEFANNLFKLLVNREPRSEYSFKGNELPIILDKYDDMNEQMTRFADDILVRLIGFDKLSTILDKTIITSKSDIYSKFFNYLIMDFNVDQVSKIVYNKDTNDFDIASNEFIQTKEDKEAEEEINLIKKYVPYEERYKYFR